MRKFFFLLVVVAVVAEVVAADRADDAWLAVPRLTPLVLFVSAVLATFLALPWNSLEDSSAEQSLSAPESLLRHPFSNGVLIAVLPTPNEADCGDAVTS